MAVISNILALFREKYTYIITLLNVFEILAGRLGFDEFFSLNGGSPCVNVYYADGPWILVNVGSEVIQSTWG